MLIEFREGLLRNFASFFIKEGASQFQNGRVCGGSAGDRPVTPKNEHVCTEALDGEIEDGFVKIEIQRCRLLFDPRLIEWFVIEVLLIIGEVLPGLDDDDSVYPVGLGDGSVILRHEGGVGGRVVLLDPVDSLRAVEVPEVDVGVDERRGFFLSEWAGSGEKGAEGAESAEELGFTRWISQGWASR